MLGKIVGRDAHIAPRILLSEYGVIVAKHIEKMNTCYAGVHVDNHVVMPNHVHLLISICGAMMASRPTTISTLVHSFKTMVTRDLGFPIFQASYHDHIIRDEDDYRRIWQYINDNLAHWQNDCYYTK